jgi:hypothetical protein
MSRPLQSLVELARRERGLERACHAFVLRVRGVPVDDLRRFAAEHRAAAELLEERLEAHGRASPFSLARRIGALLAMARGATAAIDWLAGEELRLLELYRARLCTFDATTRRTIERRLLPSAVMRLAATDRLAFVARGGALTVLGPWS